MRKAGITAPADKHINLSDARGLRTAIPIGQAESRLSQRRYERTNLDWSIIEPLVLKKPCGALRADGRKAMIGIFRRLQTDFPSADIPERYGPPTTRQKRFIRWREIGVSDQLAI